MANFAFNIFKRNLMQGSLDFESGAFRMLLLKTFDTGVTTEGVLKDYNDLGAFLGDSAVVEADAAGYGRVTITNPLVTVDDTNDRGELTFDNVVFTALGDGSGTDGTGAENTIEAALLYQQIGGDDTTPGDDVPVALYDIPDTQTDGNDFELAVGSEGALHVL